MMFQYAKYFMPNSILFSFISLNHNRDAKTDQRQIHFLPNTTRIIDGNSLKFTASNTRLFKWECYDSVIIYNQYTYLVGLYNTGA